MFVLQKLLIDCVWGMWNTEGSLSQMHHQIARETTLSVHNCNSDTRQNFGMGTWHLGRDVCYQCREVFFSPHQDQKKVTLVTRTRLMRTGHRQRMSSQELEMEGMPKYQTRPTFRLSSCCFHVLEKLCSQGLRRVLGEPGVLPRTTRNWISFVHFSDDSFHLSKVLTTRSVDSQLKQTMVSFFPDVKKYEHSALQVNLTWKANGPFSFSFMCLCHLPNGSVRRHPFWLLPFGGDEVEVD